MMLYFIYLLGAYLLGSLSSAVFICTILNKPDPRTVGSKNPGTTNVLRCVGKLAALLTLVSDVSKGLIPVLVAKAFGLPDTLIASVGLAAFCGHLFPVYFRFKGGKGVATTLGIAYGLNLWLGLLATGTWILTAVIFRYSSLAALIMAIGLPAYAHGLGLTGYTLPISVLSCAILMTHHQNIRRLYHGQESQLGKPSNQ